MKNAKEVVTEIAERLGKSEAWAWDILNAHFHIHPGDYEAFYDDQIAAIEEILTEIHSYGDNPDSPIIIEMGFFPFGIDREA